MTVKAILIELDGEETRLTIDEAKKLHAALGELVGIKPEKVITERVVERSPYWYHQPIFTNTSYPAKPFDITCNASSQNLVADISDRMSLTAQ